MEEEKESRKCSRCQNIFLLNNFTSHKFYCKECFKNYRKELKLKKIINNEIITCPKCKEEFNMEDFGSNSYCKACFSNYLQSRKIKCECGEIVKQSNFTKHNKTKIHLNNMNEFKNK